MYKEILMELVSKLPNADGIMLVRDMITNCGTYVQKVVALEAQIITRLADNPEEYRQRIAEMDKQRSVSHNALISSVKIVNRLCRSVDMPPLFLGNIDNRVDVAEFAADLVKEIFQSRRL